MALMIDYKEFLADPSIIGRSVDTVSDLVNYGNVESGLALGDIKSQGACDPVGLRAQEACDPVGLRAQWAVHQAEIASIYTGIDCLIVAFVTGKMSFEEYVDRKMAILVGKEDMRKLVEAAAAAAAAAAAKKASSESVIINPTVAEASSDDAASPTADGMPPTSHAPVGPGGQIILRPHVSALMVMVNTIGVNAVNPMSIFQTRLILCGGENIVVHEPVVEVTMKIRATMASVLEAQQRHSERPNIARGTVGMPFMNY